VLRYAQLLAELAAHYASARERPRLRTGERRQRVRRLVACQPANVPSRIPPADRHVLPAEDMGPSPRAYAMPPADHRRKGAATYNRRGAARIIEAVVRVKRRYSRSHQGAVRHPRRCLSLPAIIDRSGVRRCSRSRWEAELRLRNSATRNVQRARRWLDEVSGPADAEWTASLFSEYRGDRRGCTAPTRSSPGSRRSTRATSAASARECLARRNGQQLAPRAFGRSKDYDHRRGTIVRIEANASAARAARMQGSGGAATLHELRGRTALFLDGARQQSRRHLCPQRALAPQ
jgi:hypothetical protein